MATSLVTGCAGFVGSHLVDELLKRNWSVTGIDNFHPYYPRKLKEKNLEKALNSKNFSFVEGSILSNDDLKKLPNDVDYVFHFAAIAGVRNSLLHPEEYFEINLTGTIKLLEFYKRVNKFIFASSSSVYGNLNNDEFPVKEDHSLNPISPYGESKKQAEDACLKFSKKNNLKIAILRFYTVYGPRQRPDEAITKFIRLTQLGKPIPIYGNGNKERDFTYVSDIVQGSILAAEKGNGVYNLGTGRIVTVNQMVSSIKKSLGIKIKRNYLPSPEGDVEKTHADITKSSQELGYKSKMTFEQGIDKCVLWCKETEELCDSINVNQT